MKEKNRKPVTLRQVAEHAGVSQTTASLVLSGSPAIPEITREKVFSSIEQLGYVYNRIAANLRSNSSPSTIGLVFADLGNPYYTELLIGIHQELNEFGQTVILGTTFESAEIQDRLLATMLEHRVDGIIMFPVPGSSREPIDRIRHFGIPVVLINRNYPDTHCDYVGIDNVMGGQLATEHLIRKGHRRIAFLGGLSQLSSWQGRKQGYEKALRQAELDIDNSLVIESSNTRQGGVEAMQKILNISNPPTAVFCYNDIIAVGALVRMKEMGLIPGKDIAIVGFDDIPEGAIISPKLTTVSSFPRLMGKRAASLLHERVENRSSEPQTILLQPELIVRESCSHQRDI